MKKDYLFDKVDDNTWTFFPPNEEPCICDYGPKNKYLHISKYPNDYPFKICKVNKYKFIREVLGYKPALGMFPILKSKKDVDKVLNALNGYYITNKDKLDSLELETESKFQNLYLQLECLHKEFDSKKMSVTVRGKEIKLNLILKK